jgi:hypothetical protein
MEELYKERVPYCTYQLIPAKVVLHPGTKGGALILLETDGWGRGANSRTGKQCCGSENFFFGFGFGSTKIFFGFGYGFCRYTFWDKPFFQWPTNIF